MILLFLIRGLFSNCIDDALQSIKINCFFVKTLHPSSITLKVLYPAINHETKEVISVIAHNQLAAPSYA